MAKWKPVGTGGSVFRTTRSDGRKADVIFDVSGHWIVYVEREASPHAGIGPCFRIGDCGTKRAAMLAAIRWAP